MKAFYKTSNSRGRRRGTKTSKSLQNNLYGYPKSSKHLKFTKKLKNAKYLKSGLSVGQKRTRKIKSTLKRTSELSKLLIGMKSASEANHKTFSKTVNQSDLTPSLGLDCTMPQRRTSKNQMLVNRATKIIKNLRGYLEKTNDFKQQ